MESRIIFNRRLSIPRVPVFFNNTEEIQDYINSSLIQCSDEAEKKAVVEVVRMIIAGQ